ncbi:MAG: TIGR02597 family protein [Luteolibacter sp.]
MKTYISYSLLASAAACGMAFGQTTAFTSPVGYVTLDIPANSDANIGQPLHRTTAFAGVATTVVGSVINLPASSLTANQFVYAPPAQPNNYYVQVNGGSLNGRIFDVVSNDTSSITVLNGTTDISSITSFAVIPFWTLGTLFPAGAGVGNSVDIFEANGLVQFKSTTDAAHLGINRPVAANYFHYTGTDEAGTGWYNNDDLSLGLQNNLTIDPDMVARIRNNGSLKQVTVSGEVPRSSATTPIVKGATANDNYVAVQFPLDVTLAQSGLTAVVTPSTDIFEAIDLVQIIDETAAGINKPVKASYFYYTGAEEAGTGWYNNDDLSLGLQDNVAGILKAGRGYNVRKGAGAAGTSFAVGAPPYTLP